MAPPLASQSTATQSELSTHAARHASSVAMLTSFLAPIELVFGNDLHGWHSPDTDVVLVVVVVVDAITHTFSSQSMIVLESLYAHYPIVSCLLTRIGHTT